MRFITDRRRMWQITTLVYRVRQAERHNEDLRKRVFDLQRENAVLQEQVRALRKERT